MSRGPATHDQANALRSLLEGAPHRRASRLSRKPALPARQPPPTIAVASGKGGVGKTVLAVTLAAIEARRSAVTLLDTDFGAANADVMLGIAPMRRLDECFRARFAPGHRPVDLAIEIEPGFAIVPGLIGAAHRPSADDRRGLIDSLADFADRSRLLVLDASAGVDRSAIDVLGAADCPLIVTTPDPTAIADAYAMLKSFRLVHGDAAARRALLVVNQAGSRQAGQRVHKRIAAVAERFLGFRPGLAGVIPVDRRIAEGVRRQQPTAMHRRWTPALRAAARIAEITVSSANHAHSLRVHRALSPVVGGDRCGSGRV